LFLSSRSLGAMKRPELGCFGSLLIIIVLNGGKYLFLTGPVPERIRDRSTGISLAREPLMILNTELAFTLFDIVFRYYTAYILLGEFKNTRKVVLENLRPSLLGNSTIIVYYDTHLDGVHNIYSTKKYRL
jgi:hypothetical protein